MPVRPLVFREGARYACFGDGVCCSDVHLIGPIGRSEARRLELLHPKHVAHNREIDARVVLSRDGGCAHLGRAPGEAGCRIHATHGALAKPTVCRRFPYRLIATPVGGRVGTEHRCPCRTLGERPPIDPADALASLSVNGRLVADARVERVRLAKGRVVSFARWAALEAELLARLRAGDDPLTVIEAEPFPPLDDVTWVDVAHLYRARIDGTSCGDALAWFGDVVLSMHSDARVRLRQRPWSPAFDRAEARAKATQEPDAIFADWIADELWGLEWNERGTFADARRDLATRLVVAREIARRLEAASVRPDRAAAEAVLVCEMAGAAPLFRSVVAAFVAR